MFNAFKDASNKVQDFVEDKTPDFEVSQKMSLLKSKADTEFDEAQDEAEQLFVKA